MTLRLLFIFFCLLAATAVRAGSGMWIPMLIDKNIDDMRAQGFQLTAQDIYDANHSSLKDAVVIFGGGCTGEMVSANGLVLTNYHCGLDAISHLSSLAHDYLSNGFAAASQAEELPCAGLEVRHLVYMEDVTPAEGQKADVAAIEKKASEGGRYEAEVEEMFNGNRLFLFVYEVFRDVRLVAAPPQSLGNFGRETDNWMWPRHTADFSCFRVYAGKDNKPAPFSADNVPYRPAHHLKLNIGGLHEGDFAMVMGFPGSTRQHLTAGAIAAMRTHVWPQTVELCTAMTSTMRTHMDANRRINIDYATRFSGIANGQKRTAGEVDCIRRGGVEQKMRQNEARLRQDPEINAALAAMDELYGDTAVRSPYMENMLKTSILRNLYRGIGTCAIIRQMSDYMTQKKLTAKREYVDSLAQAYFERYDAATSADVTMAAIATARRLCPEALPELLANGKPEKIAKKLGRSAFGSYKAFRKALDTANPQKTFTNDFAYEVYHELLTAMSDLRRASNADEQKRYDIERRYLARLMALRPDSLVMSDANFTMRVAYGHIESPRTGVAAADRWFTTSADIAVKNATGNIDYALPDGLVPLLTGGDYGRYADPDGSLHTCFVGTLHTTGGNSGSPVLNARGELIGLNFDRSWYGIASDYRFDPDRSRNISVDIRYVLFVMERICGAARVIGEMEIVE